MSMRQEHSIQNVFVLALFAVFAIAILLTLVFGAKIYQNMEADSSTDYSRSMASAYLAERLRRSGETEGIRVGTFSGQPALYLLEETEGTTYQTVIYVYDGWLCELYTEEGLDLPPEAGTQLLECAALDLEQPEPGLLRLKTRGTDGTESSLTLSLRTGRKLGL